MYVAGAQQPKTRRDDGQQILIHRQTIMLQAYAETAERGLGLLQFIVMANIINNIVLHLQPQLTEPGGCAGCIRPPRNGYGCLMKAFVMKSTPTHFFKSTIIL